MNKKLFFISLVLYLSSTTAAMTSTADKQQFCSTESIKQEVQITHQIDSTNFSTFNSRNYDELLNQHDQKINQLLGYITQLNKKIQELNKQNNNLNQNIHKLNEDNNRLLSYITQQNKKIADLPTCTDKEVFSNLKTQIQKWSKLSVKERILCVHKQFIHDISKLIRKKIIVRAIQTFLTTLILSTNMFKNFVQSYFEQAQNTNNTLKNLNSSLQYSNGQVEMFPINTALLTSYPTETPGLENVMLQNDRGLWPTFTEYLESDDSNNTITQSGIIASKTIDKPTKSIDLGAAMPLTLYATDNRNEPNIFWNQFPDDQVYQTEIKNDMTVEETYCISTAIPSTITLSLPNQAAMANELFKSITASPANVSEIPYRVSTQLKLRSLIIKLLRSGCLNKPIFL